MTLKAAIKGPDSKNPYVLARLLHERSFLMFEYFDSGSQVVRAHMPFMQNINISEGGKANLATYNLLGRAGQLFSYGGAESRRISLDFELNFLHLCHLIESEGLSPRFTGLIKNTDKETDKKRFLRPNTGTLESPHGYGKEHRSIFLRSLGEDSAQNTSDLQSNFNTFLRKQSSFVGISRALNGKVANPQRSSVEYFQFSEPELNKVIDLTMYWVNLIRSSVLNNSKNTVYGPPIVRLNHGPMYMNSPCLVEDYKISIDKVSNYDVETLLPHTLKITMSLIESRTGDFGDYKNGELTSGDNLTGWEAIIDKNVLDSMNYNFEDFAGDT